MSRYCGRLAPSPTGALHLGNARTFLLAYLRARSAGGSVLMRMEDLDHPRDKPGAAEGALEDLKWLGFSWDGEYVQSRRKNFYEEALAELRRKGLAYPCVCSRADVERAQSAPHDKEQLFYPGTCRGRFASWEDAEAFCKPRVPAWRFNVSGVGVVEVNDSFCGLKSFDIEKQFGDFPLARDKSGAGYMLACIVDDCLTGVTEVVRGDDLLPSAAQQIAIARALGFDPPKYCHVPLVVAPDGRRLAKRHGDTRISSFRERGISPERTIGLLAWWSGLAPYGTETTIDELVPLFDLSKVPESRPVLTSEIKRDFGLI